MDHEAEKRVSGEISVAGRPHTHGRKSDTVHARLIGPILSISSGHGTAKRQNLRFVPGTILTGCPAAVLRRAALPKGVGADETPSLTRAGTGGNPPAPPVVVVDDDDIIILYCFFVFLLNLIRLIFPKSKRCHVKALNSLCAWRKKLKISIETVDTKILLCI